MQPRTLAITITLLPLFAINAVYIYSAWQELVPWCIPYLDGCTSISRAARKGDSIFLFRALMMPLAVLIMFYWHLARHWLELLGSRNKTMHNIMYCTGTVGAAFLILYVDFLGSEGEIYRLLRRYGVMLYFTLTPLAQMILLRQLYQLKTASPALPVSSHLLNYQLTVFMLILALGFASLSLNYAGLSTFESECIVEWNFFLLLVALFSASIVMWKGYRMNLSIDKVTL